MEKTRSNIFAEDDEPLDLNVLKQARKPVQPAPPLAEVRKVAEESGFTSREPKKQQNRFTTGRHLPKTIQFDAETLGRFGELKEHLQNGQRRRRAVTDCEVIEYLLDQLEAKQG